MIRYCATAAVLKAFSFSTPTRRLYRGLGNSVGGRQRASGKMPSYYFSRVQRMLRLSKTLGVPHDGARLLELGTGWLHWEAITARLFFDVRGVLYDVWDNRQLDGLKNYLRQLKPLIDRVDVEPARRTQALSLMARMERITDYQELYELLGFTYVVDAEGVLGEMERDSMDLIVSAGVLEHVYAKAAPSLVGAMAGVLKRGGYSVHSINIRDHLYQYDPTVSPKQYLQYSDWMWQTFFQNDVQYINKLQRCDWLRLFESAGLTLVDETVEAVDLAGLKVAETYRRYADVDLACGGLSIVHRRP